MRLIIPTGILFLALLLPTDVSAKVVSGGHNLAGDPPPVVKSYGIGDLVMVQISESVESKTAVAVDGSRSTEMNAKLAKWVRLSHSRTGGGGRGEHNEQVTKLKPAALNEPEMEYESTSSFANAANDRYSSSLRENIYVRVADVRPNGNLFIEGHKEIRERGNLRKVTLTGEISKTDVDKGDAIPSYRIYNLKVEIVEEGSRSNQLKKNLFQAILEWIWPF